MRECRQGRALDLFKAGILIRLKSHCKRNAAFSLMYRLTALVAKTLLCASRGSKALMRGRVFVVRTIQKDFILF